MREWKKWYVVQKGKQETFQMLLTPTLSLLSPPSRFFHRLKCIHLSTQQLLKTKKLHIIYAFYTLHNILFPVFNLSSLIPLYLNLKQNIADKRNIYIHIN